MDAERRQSVLSYVLSVECSDLRRRMAEVLALRETVASLDKVRKKTRRAKKASGVCTAQRGPRSASDDYIKQDDPDGTTA